MHTAKIEVRECVQWSLTRGKKPWKIISRQAPKVVAVAIAYRRWSFMRGSNYKALTAERLWLRKFWCFGLAVDYGRWSLTRGGRTWRFDRIQIEADNTYHKKPNPILFENIKIDTEKFVVHWLTVCHILPTDWLFIQENRFWRRSVMTGVGRCGQYQGNKKSNRQIHEDVLNQLIVSSMIESIKPLFGSVLV